MSGVQLRLGSSTSCGTSLAGSECSDEICLDVESDVEPLFPVDEDQEYLTSSLLNLLGGNPITGKGFQILFAFHKHFTKSSISYCKLTKKGKTV